jgi:hypothetical protein
MPSRRSRSHRHAAEADRPLLIERIARHPLLRVLAGLMVGTALWRRRALGQRSVAPVPEVLAPDPADPSASVDPPGAEHRTD